MVHYCQFLNPPGSEVYPRLSWASMSDWNVQPRQSIWCWRHCNFKNPKEGLAEELITKLFSFPILKAILAANICLAQRSLFPFRIYFLSIVYSFCSVTDYFSVSQQDYLYFFSNWLHFSSIYRCRHLSGSRKWIIYFFQVKSNPFCLYMLPICY